jgi:AmmeMemoRadiSam system protein B
VIAREPAVAGLFYPEDPDTLAATVDALLAAAPGREPHPKAVVVPHAGFVYSGPVAAAAYASIAPSTRRVALFGPSHRVAFDGLALPTVDAFRTPLGDVTIDAAGRTAAATLAGVVVDDHPHAGEHSLEVQLPFLQRRLRDFVLLPFAVGRCPAETVAAVIDSLWVDENTLIVVSTDLSHYETYEAAARHDAATAAVIASCRPEGIANRDACGAFPLRGLLHAARAHESTIELLDLRSSGDTKGPRDRVVGYGAFAIVDVAQ